MVVRGTIALHVLCCSPEANVWGASMVVGGTIALHVQVHAPTKTLWRRACPQGVEWGLQLNAILDLCQPQSSKVCA